MLHVRELSAQSRDLERVERLVVAIRIVRRAKWRIRVLAGPAVRLEGSLAKTRQVANDALALLLETTPEVSSLLLSHD
jgi:hypothetical protein